MFLLQRRINKKQLHNRGFTIVEMVIVTAIFAVLTTVIIFKYGDFNSNILVSNVAYEIALQTRQAQVFGLGSRGNLSSGSNEFSYPYGVYANLNDGSTGELGETKRFILFVDKSDEADLGYGQCNDAAGTGDCNCTSEDDECIEMLTLPRNIVISDIKVDSSSGLCEADTTDEVAITFKRPNPEAAIEWQRPSFNDGFEFAQLEITGKGSSIEPTYVLIRDTGQISVSKTDICDTLYNEL